MATATHMRPRYTNRRIDWGDGIVDARELPPNQRVRHSLAREAVSHQLSAVSCQLSAPPMLPMPCTTISWADGWGLMAESCSYGRGVSIGSGLAKCKKAPA